MRSRRVLTPRPGGSRRRWSRTCRPKQPATGLRPTSQRRRPVVAPAGSSGCECARSAPSPDPKGRRATRQQLAPTAGRARRTAHPLRSPPQPSRECPSTGDSTGSTSTPPRPHRRLTPTNRRARRLASDGVVHEELAGRRGRTSDQIEPQGRQSVKQSAARTGNGRNNRQVEFVDKSCGQQRLSNRDAGCTPMSPPGWSCKSRTNSISPPSMARAFAQSWSSGVDVTTNFATVLMNVAYGSMAASGQNPTHWS